MDGQTFVAISHFHICTVALFTYMLSSPTETVLLFNQCIGHSVSSVISVPTHPKLSSINKYKNIKASIHSLSTEQNTLKSNKSDVFTLKGCKIPQHK